MARRGRPELNLSDNMTTQFKLFIRLSLIKIKEQLKNWSVMSVKQWHQLPVYFHKAFSLLSGAASKFDDAMLHE